MPALPKLVLVERTDLAGRLRLPGDRRKGPVQQIVIHRNTASERYFREHPELRGTIPHVEALASFHAEPGPWHFRLFPYHYFVDRDGTVYRVHDEKHVSPHASGRNFKSVGIALNIDGRREKPPPPMWRAVQALCLDIRTRYPGSGIIGHSLSKRCPGPLVDVAALEREVESFERQRERSH